MNKSNFQRLLACKRTATTAAVVTSLLVLTAMPVMAANASSEARVENRITEMHARLKITAAEEGQWATVAGVMRENAKSMDEREAARSANVKTMSAVEDLTSYGEATDAHAAEIKKFAAAFTPLYAMLSDDQKADADALFRQGATPRKPTQKK